MDPTDPSSKRQKTLDSSHAVSLQQCAHRAVDFMSLLTNVPHTVFKNQLVIVNDCSPITNMFSQITFHGRGRGKGQGLW